MTADIDAVLSRLRERPECRDAVEVIERLAAERDRLREALAEVHEWALDAYHQGTDEEFEFAASNGGTYTGLSTWEEADELLPRIAALLGEPPASIRSVGPSSDVPDEPREPSRPVLRFPLDAAPALPTGEERDR